MTVTIEQKNHSETSLGVVYEKQEYISPEVFLLDFKPCPKEFYIRQYYTHARLGELQEDLMIEKDVYQVVDPIYFFHLTPELNEKWKCNIAPGKYIVDGTTRYAVIENLLRSPQGNKKVLPVPVQEIVIQNYPDDTILYRLQVLYNDTGVAHSTTAKVKSVANFIKRKIEAGVPAKEARKQAAAISRFSAGYVSHAEKFLDTDDMTPELIEERRKLFEKLDANLLSLDSVITIIQIGEKFDKTYSQILDELTDMFGLVVKPDKSLFSKGQIVEYRKRLEEKLAEESKETKTGEDNQSIVPENLMEDDLTVSGVEVEISDKDYETAKDDIQVVLSDFKQRVREPVSVEDIDKIRKSNELIAKITTQLIKIAPTESNPGIYEKLVLTLLDIASDIPFTNKSSQEKMQVVKISKELTNVYKLLTKKPKSDLTEEPIQSPPLPF